MNRIELAGCTPEPLMSYLKALGVFRLVSEQADADARLSWPAGIAVLESKLDREELVNFFLKGYRPTPVLAPWNNGSGFYEGGAEPLVAIEKSNAERFEAYRDTIRSIRAMPLGQVEKDRILGLCRNQLSDSVGAWLDTCFVLTEERVGYFPLLGTGGNDGRLEFTNNFMQRLADILPFDDKNPLPVDSEAFLQSAIFADKLAVLGRTAIGQFNPGGIGGANGIQGKFEADSRVNPWDYVLMIEGAMFFAGSAARRLGAGGSFKAVYPFTVSSVAVGYGSATASEETTDGSRAELWLPLWNRSASFPEIKYLFAEGRAQFSRRQAKDAVEFALAVSLLGVSRGVSSFVRYGFLKRNGLAFLATPLGRIKVVPRPEGRLLDDPQLQDWIDRLRRACSDKGKTPARYQAALRGIDRTLFAFANRSEQGNDEKSLVDVMRMLGSAERTMAKGIAFCEEKFVKPLSNLRADWIERLRETSVEFRLAASLAGIRGTAKREVRPFREYLEEVEVTKFVNWNAGSNSAIWSNRPVVANLAAVFVRRQLEAFRAGRSGVPLESTVTAQLEDVVAFVHGETDDEKLGDLLWGLIGVADPLTPFTPSSADSEVPFEYGTPRLLVEERMRVVANDRYWRVTRSDDANAVADPDVFQILKTGRSDAISRCVDRAARRLKAGGLIATGYRNRQLAGRTLAIKSGIHAERLLASMLFPLSLDDLGKIANAVLFPLESEE